MPQWSLDRQHSDRQQQGREISWSEEMKFYTTVFVLSGILYMGGSQALEEYIEWYRGCLTANTPPPPASPQITPQQQQAIAQAQQQAHIAVFRSLTQCPEKKTRDYALQMLKKYGIEVPTPTESIALAARKK